MIYSIVKVNYNEQCVQKALRMFPHFYSFSNQLILPNCVQKTRLKYLEFENENTVCFSFLITDFETDHTLPVRSYGVNCRFWRASVQPCAFSCQGISTCRSAREQCAEQRERAREHCDCRGRARAAEFSQLSASENRARKHGRSEKKQ